MKILTQSEWKRLPMARRLRGADGRLYMLMPPVDSLDLKIAYVELLPKQRRKARRKS